MSDSDQPTIEEAGGPDCSNGNERAGWKDGKDMTISSNSTKCADEDPGSYPAASSGRRSPMPSRSCRTSNPCFMDGQIEFDNKLTDNAILPAKLGRKNRMFIGGGHIVWRCALICTFVEQIRRHGAAPSRLHSFPVFKPGLPPEEAKADAGLEEGLPDVIDESRFPFPAYHRRQNFRKR